MITEWQEAKKASDRTIVKCRESIKKIKRKVNTKRFLNIILGCNYLLLTYA